MISKQEIYLDYQSGKPVDPEVLDAMKPYFLEDFGNPSSLHEPGDVASRALEKARRDVARFINAGEAKEIIFTSGATESNNLALIGYAMRNRKKGRHVIISEIEHISIHNIAKYLQKQGFEISKVPVDYTGKVRLEKLQERLREDTILISIQHANNEIGTIQPIREISNMAQEHGIAFHVDAVAAEGLVPIDVQAGGIDLLTLSSNDIYGPRGAGALYIKQGVRVNPIIIGGGQERGLRSGTEDIASIVGFGKAARVIMERMPEEPSRLEKLRDYLIDNILSHIPKAYLNGHPTDRLPNNAHFRFDWIEGESILVNLKTLGVAVSTGSACSSKTLQASHTLISLGLLHEEAHGSLEVTLGRWTTREEIDAFLEILPGVISRLRSLSPLTKMEELKE
ncbi:aminotransferase class V-fold PLP-dependent enzyme [Candidatus Bathyarchaeota archaeon]|nr:aminotransferase class V-fold PLP-dependent enzyme [Candidatus Bathyarchaeota archaeon]